MSIANAQADGATRAKHQRRINHLAQMIVDARREREEANELAAAAHAACQAAHRAALAADAEWRGLVMALEGAVSRRGGEVPLLSAAELPPAPGEFPGDDPCPAVRETLRRQARQTKGVA